MAKRYGLSKENFYNILDLFKKYSDIVNKVIIFGSRARGDFKKNSDIDMAIVFKKDNNKIYEIIEELETENIIYTFDIIDFDEISNEKLRNYIINEGNIIFLTNEKGEILVTLGGTMGTVLLVGWQKNKKLLKEENEELGIIMRRIGTSYVYWYNHKYNRCVLS